MPPGGLGTFTRQSGTFPARPSTSRDLMRTGLKGFALHGVRLMLQPRDEAEHDPQRDLGIGGIEVLGGMMAEAVPAADEEHDDAAEPRP